MVTQELIDRINTLLIINPRQRDVTEEEKASQAELRKKYVESDPPTSDAFQLK